MDNDIEFELTVMDSATDSGSSSKTASGELPETAASKSPQGCSYAQLRKDYEENTTKCMAFNKGQIFPLLKAAGIALVTVGYRGYDDAGHIGDMLATGPKA